MGQVKSLAVARAKDRAGVAVDQRRVDLARSSAAVSHDGWQVPLVAYSWISQLWHICPLDPRNGVRQQELGEELHDQRIDGHGGTGRGRASVRSVVDSQVREAKVLRSQRL